MPSDHRKEEQDKAVLSIYTMTRSNTHNAHPDGSPKRGASTRLHLSPHQRAPGYAQRVVPTRRAQKQIVSRAAPAHLDDSNKGKTAEGQEGLLGKDGSPVQPPRTAAKAESLADSAETLCGITASEDEHRTAGDQQEGLISAHEVHTASTASEQSHAATASGESPETQGTEAKQQVAPADSHAASDAAITSDSNSEVEAQKDVSQSRPQNSSVDEEVTMQPEHIASRKESIAQAFSSAKHSITRLFAAKSSEAAVDSRQRPVVWAQMIACFRGAQPQSPRAPPEKVPTDPARSKALAGLAHADSMLDQEQWRIGTQTEPEVCKLNAYP